MFDFDKPLLIAGLLLGVSSSLHCFGMCSGIAASLHLAATSNTNQPARTLYLTTLVINSGRIAGYMTAGAIVGGIGSSIFGAFDRSLMHAVLRWAAAASLGWVGLSMIGLLPFPTILYRAASVVSDLMNTTANNVRLPPVIGLFMSGAVWGFLPCAMVYATLFYAMLSGSWLGGAIVMLGFGLGTLPALVGTGLGISLLRRWATSVWLRNIVGLAILMLGIVSVILPAATMAGWCRFG